MKTNKGMFSLQAMSIFTCAVLLSACQAPLDRGPASIYEDDDPETGMALPPGFNEFGPRGPNPSDPFDQGPHGQAIGFYAKGRLAAANGLPDEGTGFMKIMRNRNRGWATYDMVEVLRFLGNRLKTEFPDSERLQVGDMSALKGGQLGGHRSHQNGLDADVAYLRKNRLEVDPYRNDGLYESFVVKGKASENFDVERNWKILYTAFLTGRVNRVFVDWAIKDAFCIYARKDGYTPEETELLRRMQHVDSHDDHFHLRLTCPTRSSECQDQKVPDPGHGCRI